MVQKCVGINGGRDVWKVEHWLCKVQGVSGCNRYVCRAKRCAGKTGVEKMYVHASGGNCMKT